MRHESCRVPGTRQRAISVAARALAALVLGAACVGAVAADDPPVVGRWEFVPAHVAGAEVANRVGGPPAVVAKPSAPVAAGETHALAFDGGANAVTAGSAADAARWTAEGFTALAWARVDELRRWSRFVGVVARQQDRRLGWLVGTHYDRFVFSLGSDGQKGNMTDVHSECAVHPGSWYHVAGSYDGRTMRLFVNGLEVGASTVQSGRVVLPADVPLSMVDYHDGAEFYPLAGQLNEVELVSAALPTEAIRARYEAGRARLAAAPPLVLSGCFGDRMVLQRDAPLPVWGRTLPDDEVTVTCAGQSARARADAAGLWRLGLPALAAGGPHEFVVATPRGRVTFADVLVGDVWFCAGQSNLAVGTKSCKGDFALAAKPLPQVRLFTVIRESAPRPVPFAGGSWERCDATTAADFSAVGFFFGRRIHEETQVPIGLFNASWGGTPVEAWLPRTALATLPEFGAALGAGPDDLWERSGLFNQMVNPFVPYPLRGFVWYQGENNIGNAHQYERRFGLLIRDWRSRWGQGDLPFYWVQIAPCRHQGAWDQANAELWDAQRRTLALPRTGMAVTTDATANLGDNHASNKRLIGERLALWALAKDYGRADVVPSGPLYQGMRVEGDRIRIDFEHAAGLAARDGRPLDWFTIAGADQRFVPATAVIDGASVVVTSPEVRGPVAVRFGWGSTAQPNLVNAAGLPAAPFRTDDWPSVLATGGK